jgi:hypothetical protein
MPTLSEVVVHQTVTRRSEYRYLFTPKHHGADREAAQWRPELTLEEEFAVFDLADLHELSDYDGRLYGFEREDDDGLRHLGIWDEQIAEFPCAKEREPWHGYPVYPLLELGPENRRGRKCRPQKLVFEKMVRAGLITRNQCKRLLKGKHA